MQGRVASVEATEVSAAEVVDEDHEGEKVEAKVEKVEAKAQRCKAEAAHLRNMDTKCDTAGERNGDLASSQDIPSYGQPHTGNPYPPTRGRRTMRPTRMRGLINAKPRPQATTRRIRIRD